MKIAVLDDYQDAVRKLNCFARLRDHEVVVFHDTVIDSILGFAAGKPVNVLNPEVLAKN